MMMEKPQPTLLENSHPGVLGYQFPDLDQPKPRKKTDIPAVFCRKTPAFLPEKSELDVVRHFTMLSRRNYGIDLGFYPLGSCTMKYNPKINEVVASLENFNALHPLQEEQDLTGILELLGSLLENLCEITGMAGGSLQPMAGAQGELVGMKIFRAVFQARGETKRTRLLVPDSSHGTNPSSARLAGFDVVTLRSDHNGLLDPQTLLPYLDDKLAGIMLTNPSTLGLFETAIKDISAQVHEAGGLLYYDGANLNAVMGYTRPGDMGFDVLHINLHKTFSTPHGGGGPGAGPVLVQEDLLPYLPFPVLKKNKESWSYKGKDPYSIGKVAGWYGNTAVLVRAYTYILSMGAEGLKKVSELAVLNANYLLACLKDSYQAPYKGFCKHEFLLSVQDLKKKNGTNAMDIAKGLIDHGIHPPTVYFPLIVPECLMIEPTETESKANLDDFVRVMKEIRQLGEENADALRQLPRHSQRIDEVRAARYPILSHMMQKG